MEKGVRIGEVSADGMCESGAVRAERFQCKLERFHQMECAKLVRCEMSATHRRILGLSKALGGSLSVPPWGSLGLPGMLELPGLSRTLELPEILWGSLGLARIP